MKTYLKSIVSQLKNYSESLDKLSILVDKPWAMIDEEFEIQKLIFKKNNELIMSKNGKVTIGKWDYLSEANSLLLDRGSDKILFNEGFIDQGVMILKLDGTDNKFFALANENVIPDLDVDKYLKALRSRKLSIKTIRLSDGKILEIQNCTDQLDNSCIGSRVYFDMEGVADGRYYLETGNTNFIVEDCKIVSVLYDTIYNTNDGTKLLVKQRYKSSIEIGDSAYIAGKPAPDGKYKLGFIKFITISKGKVKDYSTILLFN